MIGVHVNWSKPRKHPYQPWEILAQIVSAELYRKNYGKIKLICDEPALRVYEKLGMTSLYQDIEMLDESLLDGINPDIYFAAGKLAAQLQVAEDKCYFMDLDVLINPVERGFNFDFPYVLHRELPLNPHYPILDTWQWPLPFNKEVYALNCGIVYFPNKELRREYAALALKFMFANRDHGNYDPNVLMVTAEQRLLGIYLAHKRIAPGYFLYDIYVPNAGDGELFWYADKLGSNMKERESEYTHLWGAKNVLLQSRTESVEMTTKLLELCDTFSKLDTELILHKIKQL